MPVPNYEALMRPVLEAFAHAEQGVKDILPNLARQYELTPDEIEELLPSGRTTVLASRAHWARTYLAGAGLLESPRRGRHRVTDKGRAFLSEQHGPIDNAVLAARFPEFDAWLSRSRGASRREADEDAKASQASEAVQPSSKTPEEVMEEAYTELADALASDLLDLCLSLTPARFEQLIVDLLIAMGYGGGDERMGRQLGRSGDGGIDGVIDEDALGLDAVYVQAKRYAPENTVGRPAIQQFIGSLTGEGASKGVFVTTSSFSAEARDYAARVMQRVVLIDGTRLSRLMIRHGVGVRTRQVYEVKSVDEDYLADSP